MKVLWITSKSDLTVLIDMVPSHWAGIGVHITDYEIAK